LSGLPFQIACSVCGTMSLLCPILCPTSIRFMSLNSGPSSTGRVSRYPSAKPCTRRKLYLELSRCDYSVRWHRQVVGLRASESTLVFQMPLVTIRLKSGFNSRLWRLIARVPRHPTFFRGTSIIESIGWANAASQIFEMAIASGRPQRQSRRIPRR
jgi:hypothetical protein